MSNNIITTKSRVIKVLQNSSKMSTADIVEQVGKRGWNNGKHVVLVDDRYGDGPFFADWQKSEAEKLSKDWNVLVQVHPYRSSEALSSPPHPSMRDGSYTFVNDPGYVNGKLWGQFDPLQKILVGPTDELKNLDYAEHGRGCEMGGRAFVMVRYTFQSGNVLYQPFYRSSGQNHPGRSPEGTWLPCGGLATAESPWKEGWIIKAFVHPEKGWIMHNKDLKSLAKFFGTTATQLSKVFRR